MQKHIHIEQTADGRWMLVRETAQGERELVGTYESFEQAASAARG